MKQTTLFDYFSKIVKTEIQVKNYEKFSKNLKSTSEPVPKQNRQLVKSLIQQDLRKVIKNREDFEGFSNLLSENWFYDKDSFGFVDKTHIMSVSTIPQFNILFFKLYEENDFILIKNFKLDVENLTNKEYNVINDTEYNSVYLAKAFEILNNSFKIYQNEKLKLLFLKGKKFCVLICPKL